jgi:molybdate transport system regulatory protein
VNKLIGNVILVESSPYMSMVDIDVGGDVFSSIVLETPSTASYLKQNSSIVLFFKETEVSIAKNLSGLISLRNRFKGTIKKIEKSDILTKVFLKYKSSEIVSIISTRSANKLGLMEADEVEWLVKTNEVSLCSHSS